MFCLGVSVRQGGSLPAIGQKALHRRVHVCDVRDGNGRRRNRERILKSNLPLVSSTSGEDEQIKVFKNKRKRSLGDSDIS